MLETVGNIGNVEIFKKHLKYVLAFLFASQVAIGLDFKMNAFSLIRIIEYA